MTKEISIAEREKAERELIYKNPALVSILLSKERTILARERTVISLGQLALGILALGLAIFKFFDSKHPSFFVLMGFICVGVSGLLFKRVYSDFKDLKRKLDHLKAYRGHLEEIYYEEEN